MNDVFFPAQQTLEGAKNIFLTTHQRTDGDDLSAVLALKHALVRKGKNVEIGILGGVPPSLKFMPGSSQVKDGWHSSEFKPDCLVVSGSSTFARTGFGELTPGEVRVINFDHHPDNTKFGDINIVDQTKSSVAELVYEFFKYTNWQIDADIATCLLTGIVTDTGSFLHSNTKASTLKIASELMKKGARTTLIAKNTFKNTNPLAFKAWSRALENTWLDKHKSMICSVITQDDLLELGNPPLTVFERFVETINKVPEATFALFLNQDGPYIKGSLRSDPQKPGGGFNVGALAKMLGGGGHYFAAGFVVPGKLKKVGEQHFTILTSTYDTRELVLD